MQPDTQISGFMVIIIGFGKRFGRAADDTDCRPV
nr:MAG TPA: hypothetical protein [Caudoviricetes sp.]